VEAELGGQPGGHVTAAADGGLLEADDVGVDGAQPADDEVEAVPLVAIGDHLRALADAGADETILVVRPITEDSIRALGEALALPRE
jgi:hypothetical protein